MHLSSSEIGLILSSNIFFIAALQAPFGRLADRVNRKFLIILGGVLFSCLIVLLPFTRTFGHLLAFSVLYGSSVAIALPSVTAIMVAETRSYGMGASMSLFNIAMSLGIASGPLIAGVFSDVLAMGHVFFIFGAIGLSGVLYFALNYRVSAPEASPKIPSPPSPS